MYTHNVALQLFCLTIKALYSNNLHSAILHHLIQKLIILALIIVLGTIQAFSALLHIL